MHEIQRSILTRLATSTEARFRDLRPKNVEANLYSYHLSSLKRQGYVKQQGTTYQLSAKGIAQLTTLNDGGKPIYRQPQVLTMLVLVNERNEVYLVPRDTQPFIGTWNLPCSKVSLDDASLAGSATRQLKENFSAQSVQVTRVGEALIRVTMDEELISSVFVHVFAGRTRTEDIYSQDGGVWTSSLQRQQLDLSPAISEIIDTIRSSQQMPFFEEYAVEWA